MALNQMVTFYTAQYRPGLARSQYWRAKPFQRTSQQPRAPPLTRPRMSTGSLELSSTGFTLSPDSIPADGREALEDEVVLHLLLRLQGKGRVRVRPERGEGAPPAELSRGWAPQGRTACVPLCWARGLWTLWRRGLSERYFKIQVVFLISHKGSSAPVWLQCFNTRCLYNKRISGEKRTVTWLKWIHSIWTQSE